ncbi:23S rRNA (adenine(1618)-N(6))-methyltransferase RlmF [Shewanella yunxiaonensis]|uniref:Ribosomal RNA large subunit methyltransferase F n=1 Tax=Shewanella yunxiaonensis TaxID=2829809 RepID=A0ABX7YUM6_9GAMM|nr:MULTISPECIES: 23S rRNA (adenine(1618)-N(6))-methyltransferase RlmF [Shewanella]MDF0533438.1 23S rRNA (adenine(1618)-N(6))-methyltransferase RlmF [Shewanella sp. A32]QUN05816.1 23S rRNA (adenine(1618)-N(6))-methyltransferase RlmF [Shewanella yunxiaonensis]
MIPTKSPVLRRDKGLHPRNRHRQGYDFVALAKQYPPLKSHLLTTAYGQLSINFSQPQAVKALNAALLKQHYGIVGWDIPAGYLCPPVPGREDYLHHLADLLADGHKIPQGQQTVGLDIGTGANGIYPLLGSAIYGWQFVGSDIDAQALQHLQHIIDRNSQAAKLIRLRHQPQSQHIFDAVIQSEDHFDFTMCNPPFHRSAAEARQGSQRKLHNLATNRGEKVPHKVSLNFGGQANELWCDGGEAGFLRRMIAESQHYAAQVLWFTSLISKSENLPLCYKLLEQQQVATVKTLPMTQGNKQTRILAWSYLNDKARQQWRRSKPRPD